jgi:hypothetical protein
MILTPNIRNRRERRKGRVGRRGMIMVAIQTKMLAQAKLKGQKRSIGAKRKGVKVIQIIYCMINLK